MESKMNQMMQSGWTLAVALGIRVLEAILLWIVGRWLIGLALRIIGRGMTRQKIDPTLIRYIQNAVAAILNIVLVVAILGFFGVQTTSLAALIAAAGVAIGLAWSGRNIVPLSPTVGFVNTVIGNTNLIVHHLLEQQAALYPPPAPEPVGPQQLQDRPASAYPVLLTLFRRANGLMIASLRSRNGQALKIAETLQGGGHANASAATLPRSVKTIPDALNYLRLILNPGKQELAKPQGLSDIFDAPRP